MLQVIVMSSEPDLSSKTRVLNGYLAHQKRQFGHQCVTIMWVLTYGISLYSGTQKRSFMECCQRIFL